MDVDARRRAEEWVQWNIRDEDWSDDLVNALLAFVADAIAQAVEGAKAEGYSVGYKEGLARADAEKAQAVKELETDCARIVSLSDQAIARKDQEIARLKLELSKTADLREAWIELQRVLSDGWPCVVCGGGPGGHYEGCGR